MKITNITVSLGRTINMGNFNSARIETGATASVEELDVGSKAHMLAVKELTAAVDKALDRIQTQLDIDPEN